MLLPIHNKTHHDNLTPYIPGRNTFCWPEQVVAGLSGAVNIQEEVHANP